MSFFLGSWEMNRSAEQTNRVSFFLGSWEMNRSAEQTNRVNREAVLVRFVCSALRFIFHEPRKKIAVHAICLFCTAIHFP